MNATAAHRQTRYVAAPPLPEPEPLPIPRPTADVAQAQADLTEYGVCILTDVLTNAETTRLKERLERQAAAERALGALSPVDAGDARQQLSNLVNKGRPFLELVERSEADALAGYLLGKHFLLSSLTASIHHAPTTEPQPLHRDQGQVPATADFPASCNLFWLLDDFTPARGSTHFVPGSHRWPPAHLIKPPSRALTTQIEAPAGSVYAWDGRVWHGAGVNVEGHPRRHVTTFFCLPWTRQQENWGVTCLQEVLDEASPKLKARLGLRTYGTLGMTTGTRTAGERVSLGNYDVQFPEYIIGEDAALHPLQRVSRTEVAERG